MTIESAAGGGDVAEIGQDATASGYAVVVQTGRDAAVTVRQGDRARVMWPVRVGVPPAPADHYQDRRAYTLLVESLTSGRAAVVIGAPQRAGVVVSGLGGVGKSQLAARHAWSVWGDADVDLAVWVSALSRDAIVTAYAEAAARVLVEQDPLIADRPPEQAARSFREWLAATSRRWLVVLDDVQDPADLRGQEPPPGTHGQVVVTSRRRDAALARGGHRVIELDVFTPDEAVTYLAEALAGTIHGRDWKGLDDLARELGWLPLALSQAAAYLADQPLLTLTAYRAMLADRRHTLAELTPPEHALPEHQATIAVTWAVSIDRADHVDAPARPRGAGVARPLLEIAALLDPNGIPLAVFTAQPVLDHLTTLTGKPVGHDDVHDALTRLHRFSLITLTPDQSARAVAVHALVQRAVRDALALDHQHHLARNTADALHTVWPEIDTTQPDLAQALRSNTDTLHTRTTPALLTPARHELLQRAGDSLGDSGQVHAAITYWRGVHDQTRTHLGPDHGDTLIARRNMAQWRAKAGDHAGAVAEFDALLPGQIRALGPDHLETLSTRNDLAFWRGRRGDPAGALAEFEKLLPDQLRALGPDHPETLNTRNNIAYWRGHAGDPAGALADFEALLADQLRALGPDHLKTLITRGNIAHWRSRAGDPASALASLEALLRDHIRVLGPDHPETLEIRFRITVSRATTRDPARVVADLEDLLADELRVLGPDHPATLRTRLSLAARRGEAGDPARAVATFEALLTDQLRILGSDHPETLKTRGWLASTQGHAGDPASAVADYEALLKDQLRVLGPDHPHTLATRHSLAFWQGRSVDPARAVASLEALLTDRLRILGPDHPDTFASRRSLASWRGNAGAPDRAVADFEALLADELRVLGPDHPDTLTTRHSLAIWRVRAGDPSGAVAELEALLVDGLRAQAADRFHLVGIRSTLANARGEAGDPTRAAADFEALLADRLRAQALDHPNTLYIRDRLAHWRAVAELAATATDT